MHALSPIHMHLQKEFERSKNLKQFITESDLEKARYEMEAAGLDLAEMQRTQTLAQRQLAYLKAEAEDYVIRAPLDGVASHVWIEPAEMARQGQQLMEVMDPDVIEMRIHLKEQHTGRVKAGQRIVARFCPPCEREFSGTVDVVSPYVDSSSGTFMVRALVQPGEGADVKPGMGCEVRFLSPGEAPAGVSQAK